MKKVMESKFKNKDGFTLVELLIVVAIIGILISISIPLVNTALEKAKDATDDANFRSAAALGTIEYLINAPTADTTYWYYTNKSSQGKLYKKTSDATTADANNAAYKAQCTRASSGTADNSITGSFTGAYLKVVVKTDGTVTVTWDSSTPTAS